MTILTATKQRSPGFRRYITALLDEADRQEQMARQLMASSGKAPNWIELWMACSLKAEAERRHAEALTRWTNIDFPRLTMKQCKVKGR